VIEASSFLMPRQLDPGGGDVVGQLVRRHGIDLILGHPIGNIVKTGSRWIVDVKDVLEGWLAKWVALGEQAVRAFCAELPENPEGTDSALERTRAFRTQLGFKE